MVSKGHKLITPKVKHPQKIYLWGSSSRDEFGNIVLFIRKLDVINMQIYNNELIPISDFYSMEI